MVPQYPNKNQSLGIADFVFPLSDLNDGKLNRTRTTPSQPFYHFIQRLDITGDDLWGRFPGFDFGVDFLLHSDQRRCQHSKFGPDSSNLQQTQHNTFLIFPEHQIICLKRQDVRDPQILGPSDEI